MSRTNIEYCSGVAVDARADKPGSRGNGAHSLILTQRQSRILTASRSTDVSLNYSGIDGGNCYGKLLDYCTRLVAARLTLTPQLSIKIILFFVCICDGAENNRRHDVALLSRALWVIISCTA